MSSKHYGKYRARWENGVRRSATFADAAAARYWEQKKKAEAAEIRAGMRSPTPLARSFAELIDYWLTNRASQKRSRKDDESIIRRHLRPAFGGMQVAEIGTAAIDRFVVEKSKLSPKTVHNIVTLLVSMLRVAVDIGWLAKVPRVRKPVGRFNPRDFHILPTTADVAKFLAAARQEGEHLFALYAAAVWTGARAGELAGLEWDDISFERRSITIQRSFDGPTKSNDVRRVPIVDPLLDVLRRWRDLCSGRLGSASTNSYADARYRSSITAARRECVLMAPSGRVNGAAGADGAGGMGRPGLRRWLARPTGEVRGMVEHAREPRQGRQGSLGSVPRPAEQTRAALRKTCEERCGHFTSAVAHGALPNSGRSMDTRA